MNGKKPVNSIVCGLGEIGSALLKILKDRYEAFGIDKKNVFTPWRCYYLNICIPYSDKFVGIVNDYIKQFEPNVTIIHSTVPVGTTKKIKGIVVHSPVMAKHPNVEAGLKTYIKFIGCNDDKGRQLAGDYLGAVMSICCVKDSNTTELMKILSLTRYGLYLQIADEMKRICDDYNVNYETVVKLWESAYNAGIKHSDPDKQRPIYDPPNGIIGGHCVLQNMEIFNNGYDSKMVDEVVKKYKSISLH